MSASDLPTGDTLDDLAGRQTDLEVRVAYQDRLLTALDGVVRELADRVVALERDLRQLQAAAAPSTPDGMG
jgi:uncharacterized coiled-coil protein SlyX